MKSCKVLGSILAVSALTLSGCSNSGDTDVVYETSTQWVEPTDEQSAGALKRNEIALACEDELAYFLDTTGYEFDYLSADPLSLPMSVVNTSSYDGPVSASISSPAYSGTFSFECSTDGYTTEVDQIELPDPRETTQVTTQAAPTQTAVPIAPRQIDPQNYDSGRSARDNDGGIKYHNSVDWEFLKAPGKITPGARIYKVGTSSFCSTGFIASLGDRAFIVTAGHCGDVGDQFLVEDRQGNTLVIGEMVESYVDYESDGSILGADIGLIEIYDEAKQYVDSSLPPGQQLKGYITPQYAQQQGMLICRIGSTTGYACGVFEDIGSDGQFYFRNIVDRGDSGGAIFALDDDGAYALGVTSNVSDFNKTLAGGMEIASAMEYWGLTLHG